MLPLKTTFPVVSGGRGTKSQVPVLYKAESSSAITCYQRWSITLGRIKA